MNSLSPACIAHARISAAADGRSVMELLEEQSGLATENFMLAIANLWHGRHFNMAALREMQPDFSKIPFSDAMIRKRIIARDPNGQMYLIIADPFDDDLPSWAAACIASPFSWGIAHQKDIEACLAVHEENMRATDELLQYTSSVEIADNGMESLSLQTISRDDSAVIRVVNSTLYDALKAGVSDIHLETVADRLVIKYRLDGVLSVLGNLPGIDIAQQVISRIKVMSELDIGERRIPQDGRFKISIGGREVDFRVSIMPSIFGEDAVLRILDRRNITAQMHGMRLESLGFNPDTVERLRKMAQEPYGMVMATGPTGSGKTTTLYAAISEINDGHDKIITIEDPVEYRLAGVLQIPVNEKKGLNFARGLRSILRHDPDKIMVGEIRDPETAQIAVQSALTGHLVFTSVHANNVFDVISRFIHMGVDPFSFVSAMNGVLSQRLVRLICPHCICDISPPEKLLTDSGLRASAVSKFRFRAGQGCGECRGTGYKGRKAIAELLDLNDDLRELIIAKASTRQIKEAARANGTRFLRDSALDLVSRGETTLQEINRVTFVD